MSNDDTPQELVEQINAALRDLYDFNRLIWSALADQLDRRGILPKDDFARWMNSVADQMEEMRPNHRLGEQRLDTAMLRGIADIILDPKAEPSWKPVVLQGGKKDKSEEESGAPDPIAG